VETNVEYPTDTRLLVDALRKVIELLITLCQGWGVLDEPVGRDEIRQLKKLWRRLWQLKRSTSKDESKREARQKEIIEAHQTYLDFARELLGRAEQRRREIEKKGGGANERPPPRRRWFRVTAKAGYFG